MRLSHGLSKGRWLALCLASAVMLCGVAALQLEAVPGPSGSYARWVEEDVVYIISDEERSAFLQLTTAEEQEAFIEQCWGAPGPDARNRPERVQGRTLPAHRVRQRALPHKQPARLEERPRALLHHFRAAR